MPEPSTPQESERGWWIGPTARVLCTVCWRRDDEGTSDRSFIPLLLTAGRRCDCCGEVPDA